MRINVNAPLFAVWPCAEQLRETAAAENLSIARLEPVFSRRRQGGFGLDLIFARGREIAAIAAIRVSHEMLAEPEASPLLWPQEVAQCIGALEIAKIEDVVVPWLAAQTLTTQVNDEVLRRFSGALSENEYEAARVAKFAGAAPYAQVATAIAPYTYAIRFASGANAGIIDPDGATGAALLARNCESVRADLGNHELNGFAARWFGRDIYGATMGVFDLGIGVAARRTEIALREIEDEGWRAVSVASPVPTEIVVSFDPQDAPVARTFSVRCKQNRELRAPAPLYVPPPVGGSAGRVLLLIPGDAQRDSWPDAGDAYELARRLRAEGFAADIIAGASDDLDVTGYDLVHAFTLSRAHEYAGIMTAARAAGLPVVATAGLERGAAEAVWGASLGSTLVAHYQDEASLSYHLQLLALRRLGDVAADPTLSEPFAGYRDGIARALSQVDVLLTSGAEEEAWARSEFGYSGRAAHVTAYVNVGEEAARIDESVGTQPFALCHTPIHPLANLQAVARASRRSEIPLVLAGPVADPLYFGLLREELGANVILFPRPSAGELAALYRSARVFVDVAWTQPSLQRIARAAACGCAVVTTNRSYAPALMDGVLSCDGADAGAIEARIREAWHAAPGVSQASLTRALDPALTFGATIRAYALAQCAGAPA